MIERHSQAGVTLYAAFKDVQEALQFADTFLSNYPSWGYSSKVAIVQNENKIWNLEAFRWYTT